MVSVFNKGDKMFENQIATLTTILKDKDIHNYMGDTFWNIIKAVSLGDIGALFDSSTISFVLGQNAEIYVRYI